METKRRGRVLNWTLLRDQIENLGIKKANTKGAG